jgi:hypothetical protein
MPIPEIREVCRQVHCWLESPSAHEAFLNIVRHYSRELRSSETLSICRWYIETLHGTLFDIWGKLGGDDVVGGVEDYASLKWLKKESADCLNVLPCHIRGPLEPDYAWRMVIVGLQAWPPVFDLTRDYGICWTRDSEKWSAIDILKARDIRGEELDFFPPHIQEDIHYIDLDFDAHFVDILQRGFDLGCESAYRLCSTYEVFRAKPLIREATCREIDVVQDSLFLRKEHPALDTIGPVLLADLEAVRKLLEQQECGTPQEVETLEVSPPEALDVVSERPTYSMLLESNEDGDVSLSGLARILGRDRKTVRTWLNYSHIRKALPDKAFPSKKRSFREGLKIPLYLTLNALHENGLLD